MTFTSKKIWVIGAGALALGLIGSLILYLIPSNKPQAVRKGGTFGEAPAISVTPAASGTQALPISTGESTQDLSPVFLISQGPVISGTVIELRNPTTTVARYITAEDGHVLDLPLDTPGAAPRIASNTTIPGIQRALWLANGQGVVVQYFDARTLKSARLLLPAATTTQSTATTTRPSIRFLPDNILDAAISPDGLQIAYLVATKTGADGYTVPYNGASAKKLFSVPLTQVLLSWPSQNTLLIQQKSAVGAPGIAFSVSAKTGVVTPILSGQGLTVSASPDFSYLLYQTNAGAGAVTYIQSTSFSAPVSFSPYAPAAPEQCIFSSATSAVCAAHAGAVPADYLDRWHRGEVSVADALVSVNITNGLVTPLAVPGTSGGEYSDIVELARAKSGSYLMFVSKDDEKLWGVRMSTK